MKCLISVCSLLLVVGCGVKGNPQPPLTPPELGRGQPTFKRSAPLPLPKDLHEGSAKSDVESEKEKENKNESAPPSRR